MQALCALVKREQIDANEDLSHSGLPVRDDYAVSNRAPRKGREFKQETTYAIRIHLEGIAQEQPGCLVL